MGWTCSKCGREHDGSAFSWSYTEPDAWENRSEGDYLDPDRCVLLDDGARLDSGQPLATAQSDGICEHEALRLASAAAHQSISLDER